MQKHLKSIVLSVLLFATCYTLLARFRDVEAKQPNGEQPKVQLGPDGKPVLGPDGKPVLYYDLVAAPILEKVLVSIEKNYLDPKRVNYDEMFLASLQQLSRSVPEIMVLPDKSKKIALLYVGTQNTNISLEKLKSSTDLKLRLKDVFRFLDKNLANDIDRHKIEYTAINGMLSTLDPHTVLLVPEDFSDMQVTTKGKFGGLGIQIGIRDASLTVIAPMEGTPAYKAGIKAQDKILKIDDESTVNMDIDEAVSLLRGTPGTKVSITVMRNGWTEPQDFSITRAEIKSPSVKTQLLSNNVGYIRIESFQGNTYDDMIAGIKSLKLRNATQGLILDLRNNPGGLLDQAIKISDTFLKKGNIVSTVGTNNGAALRDDRPAVNDGDEYNAPVVVLVNGGSASASEIVSGALKNNNRAVVVGTQTFGKGSVQTLEPFPADGSALKLTIAQYLIPGDVSIQGVGVTPDILLLPSTVSKERIMYFTSEIFTKESDLDSHLTSEAAVKAPEPSVKLHYFFDMEEEEKQRKKRIDSPETFYEDAEILFAKDLLSHASGLTRDDVVSKGKAFFETYTTSQEKMIAEKLSQLGIDWTSPATLSAAGAGEATVTFGKKNEVLTAGEETSITLTVKNTGKRPLYQVRAETQSDNPLFKNLELFVGQVPVGESRSYTMPFKMPKDALSRSDWVTFTMYEKGGAAPAPVKQLVNTVGLQRPVFAYGYRIVDDEGGNGDGLLQVGEKVKFLLTVKNIGKGKSYETVTTIRNKSGKSMLLTEGRNNLDNLAPEEERTSTFRFELRSQPETDVLPIEISIADTTLREYVTDRVKIPVYAKALDVKAQEGGVLVKDKRAAIYSGADSKSEVIGYLSQGALLKSTAIVDSFVRVVLEDGSTGFLPKNSVKDASVKTVKAKLERSLQNSPPVIKLSAAPTLRNATDSLTLSGQVSDDSKVTDMYILVNDKKVFYQANPDAKSHQLKFRASVPLEKGSNRIVLIARENDSVATREFLVVGRD